MKLSDTEQVLFRLIRQAVGKDECPEPVGLAESGWTRLLVVAAAQNVAGVVTYALLNSETNIPPALRRQWALYAIDVQNRYQSQYGALSQLAAVLSAHGIRLMLLKGLGLSACYPEPSLRECSDIDIWCLGDYDRANSVFTSLGVEIYSDDEKHCAFHFAGVEIENHRKFNYGINTHNQIIGAELEKIMGNEPMEDSSLPKVLLPNPTANCLYLMTHMLNHLAWSGITVRHLLDWTLFISRYEGEIDWKYVASAWNRAGMLHAVSLIQSLCVGLLGCRPVESIPYADCGQKDCHFMLYDMLHPVPSSSTAGKILQKVRLRYLQHRRRRKRHRIVYQEPFPDSLTKSLLGHTRLITRLRGYGHLG